MTTDTTALQPGVYIVNKDTAQPAAATMMTTTTSTAAPQSQPQHATQRAHGHDEQALYNRARVVAAERALRKLQRENDTLKRSELVARHERQRLRSLVDTLRSELEAMGSTVAQQTATMMALSGVMRRSDPYHLVKERRQQAVSSARANHTEPTTDATDAADAVTATTTRNATTTTAEGCSRNDEDNNNNTMTMTRQLADQLHALQQQYTKLTRVHEDDVARIAQLQRQLDQHTVTTDAATKATPQHTNDNNKDNVADETTTTARTATRRTQREPAGVERGGGDKNNDDDDNKTATVAALTTRSLAHNARHRAARELPRVAAALGMLCMRLLSSKQVSSTHDADRHTTRMWPRQQEQQQEQRQDDDDEGGGAHVYAVQLRVLSCHQLCLPHDEHSGGDNGDTTLAARRVYVRVRGPLNTTLTQTRPMPCMQQQQQQQQQPGHDEDESDKDDCADESADDDVSCAVQYDAASSVSCDFCTLYTTAWSVCLDVYYTTASQQQQQQQQQGQGRTEDAHTHADAAVLLGSAVVPVSALVSSAARLAQSSLPRRGTAHKHDDGNDNVDVDNSNDEGSSHDDSETDAVVRSVHTATLLSSSPTAATTAAAAVATHSQRRRDTAAQGTTSGSAATVVGVVCFDCAIRDLTRAAAAAAATRQQQCARRVQRSLPHTPRNDAAHVTAALHAADAQPSSATPDTTATAAPVSSSPPQQQQQQHEPQPPQQQQLLRVYVKEGRGLMDDTHDAHGNGVTLDAVRVCAPRVLVWLDDALLCTVPEAAMSGPHPRWPASSSSMCLVRVQQQQQQQQQLLPSSSTAMASTATAAQMLRFEVQDVDETGIDPMGMATLSVARALQSPGTHELPVMLHRVQYGSLLVEVTSVTQP